MSLTALLKPAASGLNAAQPNVRRATDSVASLDGARQARNAVEAPQGARSSGLGLSVKDAERIFDQHLSLTRLNAASEASRWGAISRHLQTAGEAVADVDGARLEELGSQVDGEIYADVDRANDLLGQVSRLNADISRARLANGDASGAEDAQGRLVDELAGLMNVRVAPRSNGGVTIRSAEGLRLAGDGQAARLSYNRADPVRGYVAIEPADDAGFAQPIQVASGEIGGLTDLRDTALPAIARQLGEFDAVGGLPAEEGEAATMALRSQLAEFGAAIDRQAQAADARKNAALAVANEAAARHGSAEGVNVDEELAVMASYQQASNASVRMIQAARALLAVLAE